MEKIKKKIEYADKEQTFRHFSQRASLMFLSYIFDTEVTVDDVMNFGDVVCEEEDGSGSGVEEEEEKEEEGGSRSGVEEEEEEKEED